MQKLTKINSEKYVKSSSNAQVAQLGHLNAIIKDFSDSLAALSAYNIVLDADANQPSAFIEDTPYCLYYLKVKTPQITPV